MAPPLPQQSREDRGGAEAGGLLGRRAAGHDMQTEIEQLFDEQTRALIPNEHFALVPAFKQALNAGAVRAAEPDASAQQRLARECRG